ncbi:MAG: T9SS type A sorting domain-containing protein [candidate division WOR-3 bacterium]
MIGIVLFLLSVQPGKPWDYTPLSPRDTSWNVELVGWVDGVGEVEALAASEDGRVVYASAGDTPWRDSLVIVDISDPANPYIYKRIGHDKLGCDVVTVIDTFLYVQWWGPSRVWISELWVMDIRDPLNPQLVNIAYHYESNAKDSLEWWGWDGRVYRHPSKDTIFYAFGWLKSFSISDPLNPKLIGALAISTGIQSVSWPYAFILLGGVPHSYWEIYDLSDPSHMFLVHRDSVYEPYEWPKCIAAWEYNGKRYVYIHGGASYDYSYDVTDPTNPRLVHWGHRERGAISLVHGLRGYGGYYGFAVFDLTDPYYIPVIAEYPIEPPLTYITHPYLWANGYVVTRAGIYGGNHGLAIFHYIYDTIPEDTSDTTEHYLEWVRTIYTGPELSFSISQQAHVSFTLFNISGQKAHERDLGTLAPGPHTISLPGLKPGVYFLHLRINNKLIEKKIIFTQEGGFYRDDNPIKPANKGSKETKRRL